MSKNYPTRMHELLGVEVNERFRIAGYSRSEKFYLLGNGTLTTDRAVCYQGVLVEIINHPECIIRKPRLTEEQVKQLGALVVFDRPWIAKDKDGSVFAFKNKPGRNENKAMWIIDRLYGDAWLLPEDSALADLVSWSDPEPLDIVATLKAAGVEVEE